MDISVSPILSRCPCDAGGSIPDPFPCCSVMAAAHSSLHSTAMPCHLVFCHAMLCHTLLPMDPRANPRSEQLRDAQGHGAHGTCPHCPPHNQDRDIPVLAGLVGQDHSLPHVPVARWWERLSCRDITSHKLTVVGAEHSQKQSWKRAMSATSNIWKSGMRTSLSSWRKSLVGTL